MKWEKTFQFAFRGYFDDSSSIALDPSDIGGILNRYDTGGVLYCERIGGKIDEHVRYGFVF